MSKEPNIPPPICIFCGSEGGSEEHIWSAWLTPFLPKEESHIQIISNPEGGPTKILAHEGPVNSHTIVNVCGSCNNGWMSRAVNNSRNIVLSLMEGNDVEFDPESIIDFCTYIAITTITAEFTKPDQICILEKDRKHLYNFRRPPLSRWTIAIGKNDTTNGWPNNVYWHRTYIGFSKPENGVPYVKRSQLSTYTLRSLFVQIFTSTDKRVNEVLGGTLSGEKRVIIWPPAPAVRLPFASLSPSTDGQITRGILDFDVRVAENFYGGG